MALDLDAQLIEEYRGKRRRVTLLLVAIWFGVSIAGIWFVRILDAVAIAGLPLGYWLGSQGCILVFVGEVFFYSKYIDRLDRRYGFALE